MTKEDCRKLSAEQQYQLRKQVVRLHESGMKMKRISVVTGMSYPGVRKVVKAYEEGGAEAIKPQAVGRKVGEKRSLTKEQEVRIRRMICDKRPEQLKLSFALWTRDAVAQLVERECQMKLSERTMGKYLKRWGFTPQKPIRRFYEQRPSEVQRWLDDSFPAIAKRCHEEKGEIHWGDETAVVNTDVRGRGYSPRGQTPVTYTVGGQREKLSMISTVTNQGKTRWMIIDGAFNVERLLEFLEALIKDALCKIFLILDNLRVHHARAVRNWLEEHKAQIEVFYLPAYSPELNPDERLNASLKHKISTSVPVRTKAKLHAATHAHMEELNQTPERVRAFFNDPKVSYAK
jgi:transposase